MVNEEIVGTDVNVEWTFDKEGDLSLVKGGDNLSQAIFLRLSAYFNSLSWAYDLYGSYVKDWLGSNQNIYERNTLLNEVKKRCLRDSRINDVEVQILDWTGTSIGIKIDAEIVDGTSFQEYYIFSDLPRTNDNINSPQWSNTWIDTKDKGYYGKPGEYVTVHCYVRDKANKIVPVGEVVLYIGGYKLEISSNPQEVGQSGSSDPGGCTFTFRVPPFIKKGTHDLIFKYKGIKGYNNCEGKTNLYVVPRLPTSMEYIYPVENIKHYYANDYDYLTDPIVKVKDGNNYDVLHGEVRYYLSEYLKDGILVYIPFPIIFHNSVLIHKPCILYCSQKILEYSDKFIFNVNYMFRPGDIFEITSDTGEHIDYVECMYSSPEKVFILISTIASKPHEGDDERNKDIDTQRLSNSHIIMGVVE